MAKITIVSINKELIAKEKPLTLARDLQSAPSWVRKYIMDLQKNV